jgi:hypothetical protein
MNNQTERGVQTGLPEDLGDQQKKILWSDNGDRSLRIIPLPKLSVLYGDDIHRSVNNVQFKRFVPVQPREIISPLLSSSPEAIKARRKFADALNKCLGEDEEQT